MKHRLSLIVVLALLAGACASQADFGETDIKVDASWSVPVGMGKGQVAEKLGPPTAKQQGIKEKAAIFGVIEEWWGQLKDGDRVEIWDYAQQKGTFSVYFLNEGEKVWHTSFVGKKVVF